MKLTIFKKKQVLTITFAVVAAIAISSLYYITTAPESIISSSSTSQPIGFPVEQHGTIEVVPLLADSTGVDLQSDFKILTTGNKFSKSYVEAGLTVTPGQNFKLKAVSDTEFLLSFDDHLRPNSIYQFALAGSAGDHKLSWAFQTKKTFAVVRTLPRDKSTYVPIDTGIEISFSHENMENIEKYFEITPQVKGRFEYHKKTVVFVPEKLEQDTVYMVTIKKGLGLKDSTEKINEDYVFAFQTRSTHGSQQETEYLQFLDKTHNFTTQDQPVLEVYANQFFNDRDVDIIVHQYDNEKRYIEDLKKHSLLPWAYVSNNLTNFETEGLPQVAAFKTKVYNPFDQYWGANYLLFPSSLPEGYYLVSVKTEKATHQTHIQVNDMAVYVMVDENQSLFWVNDSLTGNSVEKAVVEVEGLQPVPTGADGVGVMPGNFSSSLQDRYFTITRDNHPAFVVPIAFYTYWHYQKNTNSDYWTHLYLDRDLYLPNDTIKIWGVLKPRYEGPVPKKAVLNLYRSEYTYGLDSNLGEIGSQDITLTSLGSFQSQIELSNLTPGTYYVQLKLDDVEVMNRYFEIRHYTKPAYKLELQSDKNVMFAWEELAMDIKASFFEGSPVAGLKLNYSYYLNWNNRQQGTIDCGNDGSAQINITSLHPGKTWRPSLMSFYAHNALAEEAEISANHRVLVFPKDTMLEVSVTGEDNTAMVEINSSRVNIDKLKGKPGTWFAPEEYRGNAVDMDISVLITEEYWVKEEVGDYYDFINKTVRKRYHYQKVQEVFQQFDAETVGGRYSFDFPLAEGKNYVIEVQGFDSRQNEVSETFSFYRHSYPSHIESPINYLYLKKDSKQNSFKLGDTVSLIIEDDQKTVPENTGNKFLYLTLKNGLLSYEVTDQPRYSFEFTEDYIPNIVLKAAFFDGTNVYRVLNQSRVLYDYREKELQINLKTDKQAYQPGETVRIEIEVKDNQGKPYSAEVNLSVVDEAFFKLSDQRVDTLASLYAYSFYSGILAEFISYKPIDFNIDGGAEHGGEGEDESVRYLFEDTAFFDKVITDENGKGQVSFQLPHNLTSWRITYQGVTKDLKAGSGKINVPVNLPFFVDVIFNNIFMVGDTPFVTLRSFGTEIVQDKEVHYSVTLEKQNGDKKLFAAAGKSSRPVNVMLDNLEEGNYSLTVEARYAGFRDALRREFKVVNSSLEATRVTYYQLTDMLKIEGGNSLTTLTFYNEDISAYNRMLNSLAYTWGERVDQKLSRKLARDLRQKYFAQEDAWAEELDLEKYQLNDGGIALFTYDSSSPEISAKIASFAHDLFDTAALKWYFYKTLQNSTAVPEDVAASYWGLAVLREPVLIDIKNLLSSPQLGVKERLYLGLALAELGDLQGAQEVYRHITQEYGKVGDRYAYIDSGGDRDDIIERTSLCSILSQKINSREKTLFFNYVIDNSTRDILTNLEKLLYVTHSIPETNQTGTFTLVRSGEKQVITLNKTETYQMVLTREALADLKITGVQGDITVAASFTGPVADLMEQPNSLVQVQRSYSPVGKLAQTFKQSDLIKITIQPHFLEAAPDGFYEITDMLPAGFRYVSARPNLNDGWYPGEVSGQKVVFGYYYNKNRKYNPGSITYYARAVSPGKFTADHAIFKHSNSNVAGFAEKTVLIIQQ